MSASSPLNHDDVSRRAYSIWERHGRPQGSEQDHWYDAERELMQTGVPSLAAEVADDRRAGQATPAKPPAKR